MSKMGLFYPLLFVWVGLFHFTEGSRCNEVICASVVSKCMLTQACKCDISRDQEKCTCCVDCAKCLGRYYQQCCSCLEMCDQEIMELDPNDSQVGDFADPFIELFEAVTLAKEPMLDGIVITYPADQPLDEINKKYHKHKFKKESYKNEAVMPLPRTGVNCTVAFMSQCYSVSKCREQCTSIGSGSYRFFFNGCCECIGPTCLNYGLNESKCPLCSSLDDDYYDQNYVGDDPSITNEVEEDFIL